MSRAARPPLPPDRRRELLPGFLLFSLCLHLMGLALPLPPHAAMEPALRPAPLAVHLARTPMPHRTASAPVPAPRTEAAPGNHPPARRESRTGSASATDAGHEPAWQAEHRGTSVDAEAIVAAARSIAKERKPALPAAGETARPLTVEAAVAKATRRGDVVESRGAAGEWIVRNGKSRCVTPLHVPSYLEGKSMLTLCEAGKG